MGIGTRTRTLERDLYLTDGVRLWYVMDLPEGGQAIIEDAVTTEVRCIPSSDLNGWRVVDRDQASRSGA